MRMERVAASNGFRPLSTTEMSAVSGGSDDNIIVVTGKRPDPWVISISPEDLWMYMTVDYNIDQSNFYGDGGGGGFQDVGWFDELKEWLQENGDWLAGLFGYDLIDTDDQAALNSELSDKQVKQVGTHHFSNGDSWNFVDTTDGVRYYDRNGDGYADLAVKDTPFGVQTNTGDGAGWTFPQPGSI